MERMHWSVLVAVLIAVSLPAASLAQDSVWQMPPDPQATPPAVAPTPPPVPAGPPVAAVPQQWSDELDPAAPQARDRAPDLEPEEPGPQRFLHGFRLGYNFTFNYRQRPCDTCQSLADEYGLKSPHSFVLGYEIAYRMVGNSWLNVLLVANASVTGLEQSLFLPSGNLLVGFELDESFQVGVGMNLAPDENKVAHMIAAAGWTPRVGTFYTPLHVYFVPDVDGNHRAGATVGVTW